MVEKNQDKFEAAGLLKTVTDLANILDMDLFQVDPEKRRYDRVNDAETREEAFNVFCHFFLLI